MELFKYEYNLDTDNSNLSPKTATQNVRFTYS